MEDVFPSRRVNPTEDLMFSTPPQTLPFPPPKNTSFSTSPEKIFFAFESPSPDVNALFYGRDAVCSPVQGPSFSDFPGPFFSPRRPDLASSAHRDGTPHSRSKLSSTPLLFLGLGAVLSFSASDAPERTVDSPSFFPPAATGARTSQFFPSILVGRG